MDVKDEDHEHWPSEFHRRSQSPADTSICGTDHEHWPAGSQHVFKPSLTFGVTAGERADDETHEHWPDEPSTGGQWPMDGLRHTYLVPQQATGNSTPERNPASYTYPRAQVYHQHLRSEAAPPRQNIHTYYPPVPLEARLPPKMASNQDVTYTYRPQKTKPAPPPTSLPWYGRTKEQVTEDNMTIAAREGAYEPRNVVPAMKDDQVAWVIEADGIPMLHSFAAIKGMKGKWMPDPRYKESWYFVRETDGK